MRRLLLALLSLSAVAALAVVATSSSIAAAPMPTEITGYEVTSGGTWTDPETQLAHRYYSVTISFSHTGPTEARVYEKDSPTAVVGTDSDHAWFKGAPGTDAFTGSVGAGLVGQPVYFDLFLYQRGPHHTLQVVDSLTVGPYTY
jgi:hypothetical protein